MGIRLRCPPILDRFIFANDAKLAAQLRIDPINYPEQIKKNALPI
jgi:hypothetical protein